VECSVACPAARNALELRGKPFQGVPPRRRTRERRALKRLD
jgi:hypothetical protein